MKPVSLGLALVLCWGPLVSTSLAAESRSLPLATRSFDPLLASGLSLAFSGGGQLYKGDTTKALWMFAPTVLFPFAWMLDNSLDSSQFRLGAFALMTLAKGVSVWDAFAASPSPEITP